MAKPTTYVVREQVFVRVSKRTMRQVRSVGRQYNFTQTEPATETQVSRAAAFEVEIDLPAIIDELVASAKNTKSLRSSALHGLIKCKAVKVKVLTERTVELPLRPGFELEEPK